MVATWFLTLSGPIAQDFGMTAEAASGLFAMILAIFISAVIAIALKEKFNTNIRSSAPWVFGAIIFIEILMSMLDWFTGGIVLIILVAAEMKIGHSD